MAERLPYGYRRYTAAFLRQEREWESYDLAMFDHLNGFEPITTKRQTGLRWQETRLRIFARDNSTCRYCGEVDYPLECDHVVPVSRGGSSEDSNLVAACFLCNRSKRDLLIVEWRPDLVLQS
jgi:HNH endonuclease